MIGTMHCVSVVIPMVKQAETSGSKSKDFACEEVESVGEVEVNRVNAEDVAETGKIKWDLSHLEESQMKMREEVFTEQMDLFSTSDIYICRWVDR